MDVKIWNEYRRIMENQRGAFLVLMVVILPLILIFAGLAVDLGRGYSHRAKLQNAADAAVMAAAHIYFPNKDRNEVYEWAQRYMDANRGEQTYKIDQITVRELKDANSAEKSILLSVYASELVPVSFMAIAGFDAIPVDVVATAKIIPGEENTNPGVWGYAFICGDNRSVSQLNGQPAPFQVWNEGHRVYGKVHTNGAVAVTGNGTKNATGTRYSVFVEPENFSTSITSDPELWAYSGISDNERKSQDGTIPPWFNNDVKVTDQWGQTHWRNYIRFGYYENNPWGYVGTDVVANGPGKVDIALREDNKETKAIYDYVEDLRKKYGDDAKSGTTLIKVSGDYGDWKTARQDYSSWRYHAEQYKYDTIVVDGSVTIYTEQFSSAASHLKIISLHGDVYFAATCPIKALIYAPNGKVNFEGEATYSTTEYSFEGSIVGKEILLNGKDIEGYDSKTGKGKYVTYKWNDFGFGTGTGSGGSGSGSGSGDSSTGSASSITMHKDVDSAYGNETVL